MSVYLPADKLRSAGCFYIPHFLVGWHKHLRSHQLCTKSFINRCCVIGDFADNELILAELISHIQTMLLCPHCWQQCLRLMRKMKQTTAYYINFVRCRYRSIILHWSTLLPIEVIESVLEFILPCCPWSLHWYRQCFLWYYQAFWFDRQDNVSIYPEISVNTAPDNLFISAVFWYLCSVSIDSLFKNARKRSDRCYIGLVGGYISGIFVYQWKVKSSSIFLSIFGIVVDEIVCMFVTFSELQIRVQIDR